ncbi:AgmX/PglI C-terminal domain-containing protein [Hyalangium rubrum]|uniref:AgmX/PglI C-terminal domain-containing protein n=1 Tax=Hyalangium rubrum TaxID=3103134 RepID=A0ABU5H5D3_9BACT|nr:AgmX/PglI C-terminal domain-containing protein [Hyalangium sp. s54d21]MDY7228521.1 AgmX/PglI C-terminal domain-containing protein [Hyalangium sp. s54d21]
MNFSCDNCQRRYSIADEKVRGKTVKVRCKNCQNVISVQGPPLEMEESTRVVSLADVERIREQERAVAAAASAPAARAAPSPWEEEPTRAAPARPASAPWFVMVKSKQEGPLDEAGLRGLMDSGAINARSFFWQQGMADWKRGSDIAELAALFAPPPEPQAPPELPPEPATVAVRGQQQRSARAQPEPEQDSSWDDQPTSVGHMAAAPAGREPWDLDPPESAQQPRQQQAQQPWDMQPEEPQQDAAWNEPQPEEPQQDAAWNEPQPEEPQQDAAWNEPEQPAASGNGKAGVGDDLFSDLDLPDRSEPEEQPEPPTAVNADADPLAAVGGKPAKGDKKKPVEDTRHFMVQSGVTRRNPVWKIALFVLLPILLLVGGAFALDRVNVIPKMKTVTPEGKTVEKSYFSGEGVSELRDRLMGRNKPAPTPAPVPPGTDKKPQPSGGGAQKPAPGAPGETAPVPETGKSAEELKALYGDTAKTAVGPEVREDAEVAAKDAAGQGGPPQEDIARVVAQSQGAIQSCVEQELRKNPSFKGGKVTLVATVGTSGTVKSAKLDRKDLDSAPVGECIKKGARKMVFPSFKAEDGTEEVELQIPLVLSSGAM